MIKGSGADEGKAAPTQAMLKAMTAYNERLAKAGILLDGAGLKPSADGVKVVLEGGTTSVVDGPFVEAKEIIGGYWIWQVRSLEEAVEWAKQCPTDTGLGSRQVMEIRPYGEVEDFGEAYTPEIQEREERITADVKARHGAGR